MKKLTVQIIDFSSTITDNLIKTEIKSAFLICCPDDRKNPHCLKKLKYIHHWFIYLIIYKLLQVYTCPNYFTMGLHNESKINYLF